ncbi:MAG: Dabb family protein [Planctomycetes bacterium]|nr:Dabb family protein [Planctomycetota bacterium]
MITHVVLLRVQESVPAKEVERVFGAIGALKARIPGILAYSWGPYSSPEGLHKGFTHGFVMTFTDAAARDGYLSHSEHEVVKGRVLAILDGGLDGVIAFDYAS